MSYMARGAEAPGSGFDVFISFTHADVDWVRRLAENLNADGLHVFLDEWEIRPGDIIVHRINDALRTSRNGAVVVSAASMQAPWVAAEYAAMQTRAIEGRLHLIPVLYGDAEMPPLLATHLWVDFRDADGPEYERRVRQLAAALRGERPPRASHGGGPKPPPGTGVRAEGPLRRTLRVSADEVTLLDASMEVAKHRPRGIDHADEQRLWNLEHVRRQWPEDTLTRSTREARTTLDARLEHALLEAGIALGRSALVGPVGDALRQAVEGAEGRNVPLELALEIDDGRLADLPWEALRVPASAGEFGPPLALHSHVRLYRSVRGDQPVTGIQIRGPLRVLVAIGSPESDDERGELLDYEAELAAVLDVVEAARSFGGARVRILERGTVAAIREALLRERYHVLHVSCHAGPGRLLLEDEDGRPDLVDADRFMREVLPAGRGVPLLVLAGCYTALSVRDREERATALPGLARTLLARGVPSALAMNAPVGDVYATLLMERFYRVLATAERPDPLAALSDVRRQIEIERPRSNRGTRDSRPEWSTPTLFRRGPGLPLYVVTDGLDKIEDPLEPQFQPGIVVRRVGDFVGRRREERLLLRALLGDRAGVVIHGLGGVGKSTLSAEVVSELAREPLLVIPLVGQTSVDQVLHEAGQRLLDLCTERGLDERHPYRELSGVISDPRKEWSERLSLLTRMLLGREPAVLLLDNFEDNLVAEAHGRWRVADASLAELLTWWVRMRGRSHLVVTSRYPFVLPEGVEGRLHHHHLGPLSLAETRKLVWRLPGLDALSAEDQVRAYADVGGHPRTLEYLDALLRGGRARFDDVAERMERALAARNVAQPRAWLKQPGRDLDQALAEAVTLAVDDILLEALLARLDGVLLARRLLLGASVYRVPVDAAGLAWQVSEEVDVPAEPDRDALAEAVALVRSREPDRPEEEVRQFLERSWQAWSPPLRVPDGLAEALAALDDLGLLAPVEDGKPGPRHLVHRWTARALAELAEPEELAAAHRHAGRYWTWRVRVWPQPLQEAVPELVEARHHLHATGDVDTAVAMTNEIAAQLHTWGAYGQEERLCLETLGWVPERSHAAADYQHRLGIIAQARGNYDAALERYRDAFAICQELGDRRGMAGSHFQLARVAEERGDYDAALDGYRRSLAIMEDLNDRREVAGIYHQFGIVAEERGEYDAALDWYRRSLAIREDLDDRADVAASYFQLGNLAYRRGDYDAALDWYRQALAIAEEQGDRVGMSNCYHQLGMVEREHGEYDAALYWYRRSLVIEEELNNRAGIATSYHELGIVAEQCGDYDAALDWYQRSLAINEELRDRAGIAKTCHEMGVVAEERGEYGTALDLYRRSLEILQDLDDRAGIAASYDQLGILARKRNDYDAALDWHRRSLTIMEDLGNRAGIGLCHGHIGVVLTETGRAADAVPHSLAAFICRAVLRVPPARDDVSSLARQLAKLGPQRFAELARGALGEHGAAALVQLLGPLGGADS
jgi:tetratricopeptide (TPR) repeat protein